MSSFALERHLESPTSLTFPTPLLLGMEFTERSTVLENELSELQRIHQKNDWVFDLSCTERYLQGRSSAIIVTDTHQHITWTSRGFVRMTGYTYCEAFHQKPTFLQGPRTLQTTRAKIRETLEAGEVFEGSIINYRKSGALYSCQVTIIPILNSESKLTNFIALEEEKKNFFQSMA
jgi:PAS domain S-box-containing protein